MVGGKEYYDRVREEVVEEVEEALRRLREIDGEIEEILKEIRGLNPVRGSLVYKWVRNKVGRKYWYWYLHIHTSTGTRSIYIGKWVPDSLMAGLKDRARLRYLQRRLKSLRMERRGVIERLKNTLNIIAGSLEYA